MSRKINQLIDHTKLSSTMVEADVMKLCTEANLHGFASVCIPPYFVTLANALLIDIPVCTVIGFPLSFTPTNIQLSESTWAIQKGAEELDLVVPLHPVKAEKWDDVKEHMLTLTSSIKSLGPKVKWILETANLSTDEIRRLSELCVEVKADFVKTSTGFASRGASLKDVEIIKSVVGDRIGIKASGGIRDRSSALAFIDAGATRLGTSSALKLIAED